MNTSLQSSDEIICAFNADGLGMQNSKTSYSFYECPEALEQRIDIFARNFTDVEKIAPWPMGDHMLFASAGIPAVAVTASDIFMLMDSVIHTPADTLPVIDLDSIARAVHFLHGCI